MTDEAFRRDVLRLAELILAGTPKPPTDAEERLAVLRAMELSVAVNRLLHGQS